MLQALPRRHSHRGPFVAGALPRGLLADLEPDAVAGGAALASADRVGGYERLAGIVSVASRDEDADPGRGPTRGNGPAPPEPPRDSVPAAAFTARADLHRGGSGSVTSTWARGDDRGDWLCVGHALHRPLARSASCQVFASLHAQPLQAATDRALLADRLGLVGHRR